jgi:Gluconate 2-dehydrogenase subunit 3
MCQLQQPCWTEGRNGVVFWGPDGGPWKPFCLPGRLSEYAFTGDHEVQGEIMQRREVLRLLAAGAALPVLPSGLLAHLHQAQAQVGSSYKLRTLDPQQNALVVTMIDLTIPETDTPGAKGARVNEFIDVILTEWATDSERAAFLAGLADVDKQSNALFGTNFVDASVDQQTTLLRAMDDVAMAHHGARRPRHNNTIPAERDKQLQGNFWDVFKGITVHGYYTSEIGFTQEEHQQLIPGAYHGCVPMTAEKKA